MGPLWDFDLAYNGHPNELTQNPEKWFIRNYYWNYYLFKNNSFLRQANSYWISHRDKFKQTINSLSFYGEHLKLAAENNFKRWPILQDTNLRYHPYSYSSYNDAVVALKNWIETRISWIDYKTK